MLRAVIPHRRIQVVLHKPHIRIHRLYTLRVSRNIFSAPLASNNEICYTPSRWRIGACRDLAMYHRLNSLGERH